MVAATAQSTTQPNIPVSAYFDWDTYIPATLLFVSACSQGFVCVYVCVCMCVDTFVFDPERFFASVQPFIDIVWMYFLLRFLEVKKTGGDWKDVFLFGDGFKIKVAPASRESNTTVKSWSHLSRDCSVGFQLSAGSF